MQFNFDKAWLLALEERFGTVSEIREVGIIGRPKIMVFYFKDFPQKGMLTAITGGLSNSTHPDWKMGRPELMITQKSSDFRWGKAIAFFASAHAGDKTFQYGDTFKLDFPMSEDSDMNACFVFQPPFLEGDDKKFIVGGRIIYLAAMFPLYDEEIDLFGQVGIGAFATTKGYDCYDPKRPRVTKEAVAAAAAAAA